MKKKENEPTQKIKLVSNMLLLVDADVYSVSATPCLNSCADPFQPVHVQGKPVAADRQ